MNTEKLERAFLGYISAGRNALTVANQYRDAGQHEAADDEIAFSRAMIRRAQFISDNCEYIRTKYNLGRPCVQASHVPPVVGQPTLSIVK